jgi:hypothetical protein
MRSVKVALVAGLTLLAIAIGLTLLRSPMSVAGTNKAHHQEEEPIAITSQGAGYCQAGETLPRGTSTIRISLSASIGPRVRAIVSSGGRTLTSGEAESGWTGYVVAIPVRPLPNAVSGVEICASFRLAHETVVVLGKTTPATAAAREGRRALRGRMSVEYLRPGDRSWASLASSIFRNMGFGRADSGTGIVFIALALLVAVAALATRLVLTDLR